eukprot:CAMPEP_0197035674 /NCGR_PEP_ID=MMETSP1384-20130603/13405_1 /TAXON_ID=29189 /ORGANISM="Ammonia sp." /LENGTH=230 /DNA_ID=CAMNT_0042465765 /DNA_START=138 /DNA_END=830 /DNA_ORIENTATION=-
MKVLTDSSGHQYRIDKGQITDDVLWSDTRCNRQFATVHIAAVSKRLHLVQIRRFAGSFSSGTHTVHQAMVADILRQLLALRSVRTHVGIALLVDLREILKVDASKIQSIPSVLLVFLQPCFGANISDLVVVAVRRIVDAAVIDPEAIQNRGELHVCLVHEIEFVSNAAEEIGADPQFVAVLRSHFLDDGHQTPAAKAVVDYETTVELVLLDERHVALNHLHGRFSVVAAR